MMKKIVLVAVAAPGRGGPVVSALQKKAGTATHSWEGSEEVPTGFIQHDRKKGGATKVEAKKSGKKSKTSRKSKTGKMSTASGGSKKSDDDDDDDDEDHNGDWWSLLNWLWRVKALVYKERTVTPQEKFSSALSTSQSRFPDQHTEFKQWAYHTDEGWRTFKTWKQELEAAGKSDPEVDLEVWLRYMDQYHEGEHARRLVWGDEASEAEASEAETAETESLSDLEDMTEVSGELSEAAETANNVNLATHLAPLAEVGAVAAER